MIILIVILFVALAVVLSTIEDINAKRREEEFRQAKEEREQSKP